MASPQLENGYIKIAFDLDQALIRADLSCLEKDLTRAVMQLTYGQDKTKARLDVDDLRVMVTGERRIRSDRIAAALEALLAKNVLFKQTVNQANSLWGLQKDFDKWQAQIEKVDKMSRSINRSIYTNTSYKDVDKMSTVIWYAHRNNNFTYGIGAYRTEAKHARQLYKDALLLTKDPMKALQAIKDYIDDLNSQEWFKGCKMRFVYMSGRFKAWYASIPVKPKSVRDQEEITGYKFRWNLLAKDWEKTDVKR